MGITVNHNFILTSRIISAKILEDIPIFYYLCLNELTSLRRKKEKESMDLELE